MRSSNALGETNPQPLGRTIYFKKCSTNAPGWGGGGGGWGWALLQLTYALSTPF